jgi:hypothetical protein
MLTWARLLSVRLRRISPTCEPHGIGLTVINTSKEGKEVSPHFLNRSDSGGSVFLRIVGLGKNCG